MKAFINKKKHHYFQLILAIVVASITINLPMKASASNNTQPTYIWWEAEHYQQGDFPKSGPFDPHNKQQADKLSNGRWINTGSDRHPKYKARYLVDIPSTADYHFYVRKFWYHGNFRYRFNQGVWQYVDRANFTSLKGSVTLRRDLRADWIRLNTQALVAGNTSFEIELTDDKGAAAFDAFVLTRELFDPLGLRKPGKKLNLADKNYWSFEPDIDLFSKDSLWDLRYLNEDVAGQNGYLSLSEHNNSFVLANQKPVRFWAVNTTVQRGNNQQEIERHARHLAKRGVNMVRFHGFLESKTDDINTVDQRQVEQSWRLVAAMKQQGIYTTLSPYWGVHAKRKVAWDTVLSGGGKNLTALLFFDPELQKAYKNWLKQWLLPNNPYTGIPLAKDTSVAVIQIQNEDSLLFWTLRSVQGEQRRYLEKRFGDWLQKKYGHFAAVKKAWQGVSEDTDDFSNGYAALVDIFQLTEPTTGKEKQRLSDQYQFLVETMYAWNKEVENFLRKDIGYQGLINAGNWRPAKPATMLDGERWSYTANQVIATNRYYNGGVHVNPVNARRASYLISEGDFFQEQSLLFHPNELPINIKQVQGFPMMVTESTWVSPNSYQSEGPFLIAAYSSLTGIDGYYWFATAAETFDSSMAKFPAAMPSIMATYPAAALLFRKGYVQQATPMVNEHRSVESIWQRQYPLISEGAGFDPNRDKIQKVLTTVEQTTSPLGWWQKILSFNNDEPLSAHSLSFLVGPVISQYDSNPDKSTITSVAEFVNYDKGTVTSNTKELVWNYKKGLSTINTKKAQGVTGFVSTASPIILDDIVIESSSHYATILAVPLDDKVLKHSTNILLQITTRSRPYQFIAQPTTFKHTNKKDQKSYKGYQIKNLGSVPMNMEKHQITFTINNTNITQAIMTDINGYTLRTIPLTKVSQGIRFTAPPTAIYIILK